MSSLKRNRLLEKNGIRLIKKKAQCVSAMVLGSHSLGSVALGGGLDRPSVDTNALNAPSLSSLASKSADAGEQGGVMGAMQSVASLARAVGPSLAAFLIYSSVAHVGFDGRPQNMSDSSIFRTFWTAAAIQLVAFLIAIYFARAYGQKYSADEMA